MYLFIQNDKNRVWKKIELYFRNYEIMKNFTFIPLILTLVSVLFLSTSSFGEKQDSLFCIEIDGKVLIPKNDLYKTYKIELLCHNTLVDSGFVVDDESFLLKIMKNSWYTIRITKEGYFPMIVSIDTRMPDYNNQGQKFHFDTELIVESYSLILDKDAIDFPIAIITFNGNSDSFLPIWEYSRNIKDALFDASSLPIDYFSMGFKD